MMGNALLEIFAGLPQRLFDNKHTSMCMYLAIELRFGALADAFKDKI